MTGFQSYCLELIKLSAMEPHEGDDDNNLAQRCLIQSHHCLIFPVNTFAPNICCMENVIHHPGLNENALMHSR